MKSKIMLILVPVLLLAYCLISGSGTAQGYLDINRATEAELQGLYRVGPVLARRIIEERKANGAFRSLDELGERVKGVGPTMLSRWAEVCSLPYSGAGSNSPERAAQLRKLELALARGETRLDLNTAPAEELELLYKVGPTLADRIVGEREENGEFISLSDLSRRVGGVGETMIERWGPYVTLPFQTEEEKPASRFDINQAGRAELESLFKVGPKLAERIITEREANGYFTSLEDLCRRVKGVGPTMAGSWREQVTNQLRE
jgi:competence ComEA-like helix-hairpin-helix protein